MRSHYRRQKLNERIDRLSPALRDKVESIVVEYYRSCRRQGLTPNEPERVLMEAIEVAEAEAKEPQPSFNDFPRWDPFRSYPQYQTPV